MIKNLNQKFKKCFELAVQGETLAFPNPNVACIIYFKEELVAFGIHKEFRKAHAEVNAINKLRDFYTGNPDLKKEFESFQDFASECELILNLEPCSHYGNTPPCTLLIKETGFRKIAFASYDTNPKVYKKSLEEFSDSSYQISKPEEIDSEIQKEALSINRTFFKLKEKEALEKLAVYVTVKIASYADGEMITRQGEEWITGAEARRDVHRLRSTNQVLITSSSTIKADNPKYTVRHDPENLNLLDVKDPDLCVVYSKEKVDLEKQSSTRKVFYEKLDKLDKEALEQLIHKLAFQGYQKIMIEAGPKLSNAFLKSELIDELIVYQPKASRTKEQFVESVLNAFKVNAKEVQTTELNKDFQAVISV